MTPNTKVRIIDSPYTSMFEVGSEHFVYSVVKDLVYLIDPFYNGQIEEGALWPFLESELEEIK